MKPYYDVMKNMLVYDDSGEMKHPKGNRFVRDSREDGSMKGKALQTRIPAWDRTHNMLVYDDFKEEEHPRDRADGRFAKKSTGSEAVNAKKNLKQGAESGNIDSRTAKSAVSPASIKARIKALNALPDRDSERHDKERQKLLDDMLASGKQPKPSKLSDIIDTIYETGGFTYDINTSQTKHAGFSVAIPGHERAVRIAKLTPKQSLDALYRYVKDKEDVLRRPENHFGGWLNPEDGVLYLDISRVTNDVKEARKNAISGNQEAFYDFQTGESVFTIKGAAQERTKSGKNTS
jgi:hypothetical protein